MIVSTGGRGFSGNDELTELGSVACPQASPLSSILHPQGSRAMPSIQLGEIRVDRIVELDAPFLTAFEMFPDASREALAPHLDWLVPGALSAQPPR